jgi:prepilin-type N-terminal cleavage/methylation domain-containing protein
MQKLIKLSKGENGFTLAELMVVVAVIGILVAIAVPVYTSNTEAAKIATDEANLATLNSVTGLYRFSDAIVDGDVFNGINSDEDRMQKLIKAGNINESFAPVQDEVEFNWDIGQQIWKLDAQGSSVPLSPLGSTFIEISTNIIVFMQKKHAVTGSYGRTWGDYKYSDLGLDPEIWSQPIGHIIYKPSGKDLLITPEQGYTFLVNDFNGNLRNMPSTYNWNIVYNDITENWYYHSIEDDNLIDIETLIIEVLIDFLYRHDNRHQ